MRERIEASSGIKAYDIYGLTEIVGPGVGMECSHQAGPHIFEDMFYPEIIDPETLRTAAGRRRGRIGADHALQAGDADDPLPDAGHHVARAEPCACGRTLRRIRRIGRRSDDMLIIRGVNVFPSQIETALLKVEGTLPHYQIILDRQKGLDQMEVQVEVTAEGLSDTVGGMEQLQARLARSIESMTGLHPVLKLVAPRTLQRSEGKAKRVLDRRTM